MNPLHGTITIKCNRFKSIILEFLNGVNLLPAVGLCFYGSVSIRVACEETCEKVERTIHLTASCCVNSEYQAA